MTAALAPPSIFDRAVACTFDIEGGDRLSLDPHDPGNWTGGRQGVGVLRGTRWGFSAAAFPDIDIEHLDRVQAVGLAFADFWAPAKCGAMPGSLAALVFDAAIQHGVSRAVAMLQRALGLRDDGDPGAVTLRAVAECKGFVRTRALCINFQTQRLLHMTEQPSWHRDAAGFARRLCTMLAVSAHFDDAPSGDAA